MIRKIKRYFKIWLILGRMSLSLHLLRKFGFVVFLLGKFLRFLFFILFLVFIFQKSGGLGSYSANQAIFFFIVFNFVSSLSQMFFRGIYTFRQQVVSGSFDLILSKPLSPLFRVIFGSFDFIDLVTIPPLIFALFYSGSFLAPSLLDIAVFAALLINSLIISFSLSVIIVSLSLITLEIDHMVMIYRDVETMARFPVDIYGKKIGTLLTYLIPLGIMITFPAKAFMGILSFNFILISFLFGGLFFWLSLRFWNFALKKYASASS